MWLVLSPVLGSGLLKGDAMKRILLTACALVLSGSATALAVDSPAPIGTAPSANFEWRHLDGIGYGWVEKGIKSIDPKTHMTIGGPVFTAPVVAPAAPVRPTFLQQYFPLSGCVDGQCGTSRTSR